MNYELEIIPGTKEFVLQELTTKFSTAKIIDDSKETVISFSDDKDRVEDFETLYSPLRITKENSLTKNLFRRQWKIENSPAGINPSLAYILCMIAEVNENDIVLDPFCGAGTIPITASKYFGVKKVLASDVKGTAVDMTLKNQIAANITKNKMTVFRSNITQLKLQKDSVSKIITNPPFGVRTGNHEENIKIYKSLADKAQVILKEEGKLVCITQEKKLFLDCFSSTYKIIGELQVSQGGLHPTIFVVTK
ncbi:methyltransferase [Candidatus Dojkabacteria bacterium]|uniref:Methyltransferase n=1 Tax=Candidatus Dojkabacteria bacterium TaxID=2099670 RepID=A0A955L230_9BACT|nr:methyltransferase [Candidatus Dojkabacteria bacterium]